jgi:hypothetical protein
VYVLADTPSDHGFVLLAMAGCRQGEDMVLPTKKIATTRHKNNYDKI